MSIQEYSLPSSSIGEMIKIIIGYTHSPGEVNLDKIAQLTGMNKSIISSNNQFLSDIGVIEGGQKKKISEMGAKLGRALEHRQDEDIRRHFKAIISTNEFLSGLITTLRIKNGISPDDYVKHIIYVSGQIYCPPLSRHDFKNLSYLLS